MNQATIDRMFLEVNAIESAYSEMRYLQFNPKNDTWKRHCEALGSKLGDALQRAEFWAANPDHKLG